jgi:sugar phosphate isomerase/epimerase
MSDYKVLTESNTGKSSWSDDPRKKAGRSKSMSKNGRANDWVLSACHILGFDIIELNPADKQMFPTPKDSRVNRIDNLAGISWRNGLTVAQCGHVADAFYRAAEWANWQKLRSER